MLFWIAFIMVVVASGAVVADYVYTRRGQTTPHRVATASSYIQRYSWVVAVIAGTLLSLHLFCGAVGKREVPWAFLIVLQGIIWGLVSTFIAYRLSPRFSNWLMLNVGFWGGCALKFGSTDNASGNIKLAVALVLWILTFLQGWPTWGPDFTDVSYQVTEAGQQAWQSQPVGEGRSVLGYVFYGGKVPFIERALGRTVEESAVATPWSITAPAPLYEKSWWWAIIAIIVTIISQIDWALTRRDDFGEAVAHAVHRTFGKGLKPIEATSEGGVPATAAAQAPTTASAPIVQMQGGTDLFDMARQFLSDLSAAFIVHRVSSKR